MPSFVYEAADGLGRVVTGRLEGESETDVVHSLEQQALVPLRMRRAKSRRDSLASAGGQSTIRLRPRELLHFSRQLKVMLASGITILTTLSMLRQRAKGNYRRLLDSISADIQRGTTLSEALAAHPRTFDPFYVGTIRAGEAAGVHTEALSELIAYHERRADLRRDVTGALTYPAIVVLTLIGACITLLTFVVPQFQSIFASSSEALPLPTRVLLGISAFVTNYAWYLLGTVITLAFVAWRISPLPAVRAVLGQAFSRLPLFGSIYYLAAVVQFSRMVSLLERAGLPLLETFKVVHEMLMAGPVKTLVATIRRKVAGGSSISDAIADTHVLPDLVEQMILVGEQTGCIDETLAAAAAHYEEEIRVKLKRLTVLLEPALTVTISALVLGVAMAIFLPMWQINSLLLKH